MKYNGKGETKWISSMSTIFYRKLWSYTYLFSGTTGSKLIHHGKVLLQNLNFYMVYVGGSEASGINRRKYYIYSGIDYQSVRNLKIAILAIGTNQLQKLFKEIALNGLGSAYSHPLHPLHHIFHLLLQHFIIRYISGK